MAPAAAGAEPLSSVMATTPRIRVRLTLLPSAVARSSPSATAFKPRIVKRATTSPAAMKGATLGPTGAQLILKDLRDVLVPS
ncbi:hypothetical protein ABIB51_004012 [Arthrobacter sp. UYCu712]